jgi:hypothetical protein
MEPMYSLIMSSSGFHATSGSLLHIRGSKPMRDLMLSLHVLHIVLSPICCVDVHDGKMAKMMMQMMLMTKMTG